MLKQPSYSTVSVVLHTKPILPCPLQPPSDADTSPEFPVATDQLQCQVQDDLCPGRHPHHDDQRTQGLCQRTQGGTTTDRYTYIYTYECMNEAVDCMNV